MTKRTAILIGSTAVAVIAVTIVLINVFRKGESNDFEYVSVEDAVKNAESVLGTKYENFTLPETLDIDVSGDLYTISADSITASCDRAEMSDKLAGLAGGGKKLLTEEQGNDILHSQYENDVWTWCYNSLTFAVARSELTVPEGGPKDGRLYIVGRDSLEDKYILNGEEYSIKQAVEYSEKFANERVLPLLINDTKLKAIAACAFKVDEENYWIFVQLQHYMFGCPVSTTGGMAGWYGDYYMRSQQLVFTFDGKDQICHIDNDSYATVLEKKKVDKMISLPSALKHLEKELAPGSKYNVTRLGLEYCSRVEFNGSEFEYRPMWCLTVAERSGDNVKIYKQRVIYIDALNGDVRCYDDIENEMVFDSTSPS